MDAPRLLDPGGISAFGSGLRRVASEGSEWLVEEVEAAGLLGRGGAFFPVADKWRAALGRPGPRVVVANGAEDEPGSLKDRVLLAEHADLVVEGGVLSAQALEADRLVIYVNVEAEAALRAARFAAVQAVDAGPGRSVTIEVVAAPAAYVAGEDSAAVEFIESGKTQPRRKPPFPAACGLGGAPTVVSNVETLAHIALIARHGAAWFRQRGSHGLPGTILVTLPAECATPGVYEVPGGARFDDIVNRCGGGVRAGLRGVQIGGPGAGWIGSDFGIPLEPDAVRKRGSMLGCAAVRILTDDTCAVDAVAETSAFFARESCGKCPPCRMETQLFASVTGGLRASRGITRAHLEKALEVAATVAATTDCALARFPAAPLQTAMDLFPDDFEAHLAGSDCGRRHAGAALAVGDGIGAAPAHHLRSSASA